MAAATIDDVRKLVKKMSGVDSARFKDEMCALFREEPEKKEVEAKKKTVKKKSFLRSGSDDD